MLSLPISTAVLHNLPTTSQDFDKPVGTVLETQQVNHVAHTALSALSIDLNMSLPLLCHSEDKVLHGLPCQTPAKTI
jgi:hypothetical protein